MKLACGAVTRWMALAVGVSAPWLAAGCGEPVRTSDDGGNPATDTPAVDGGAVDAARDDGGTVADGGAPLDGGEIAGALGHGRDPITLDGAQLGALGAGALAPDRIAGFRWDGTAFVEVALQIDEREVRPFADALSRGVPGVADDHRIDETRDWSVSYYTGSNVAGAGTGVTFVGSDGDPRFDADDELVVMASDLGAAAPAEARAPGTRDGSRVEVRAFDAADTSRQGFLYLFERTGAAPAPGAPAVRMEQRFVGESGEFTDFFVSDTTSHDAPSRGCPSGGRWGVVFPENTTITGANYVRHFAGRWISDVLRVAGGPDLLDVHESRSLWPDFGASPVGATVASIDVTGLRTCTRSITSYSGAAGTYVTLRSGPVRAIRSYFGSNSGTLNQRTHFFYAMREDVVTYLRVHPIPGIADGLDLAAAAEGASYYNERNVEGLVIDGTPDTFDRRFARWEMVSGDAIGTVLSVHRDPHVEFDAAFGAVTAETFFIDERAAECVCSGEDQDMLGAHGFVFRPDDGMPNTDPRLPFPGIVTTTRVIYGLPGVTDVDDARALAGEAYSLRVSIDGAPPIDPLAVVCDDGVCESDETSVSCPADCPPPIGAESCGNGTCGGYEAFVCFDDCPTDHDRYFECASETCTNEYVVCVGDPDCRDGLLALDACSGSLASCASAIAPMVEDAGAAYFRQLTSACDGSVCPGF